MELKVITRAGIGFNLEEKIARTSGEGIKVMLMQNDQNAVHSVVRGVQLTIVVAVSETHMDPKVAAETDVW